MLQVLYLCGSSCDPLLGVLDLYGPCLYIYFVSVAEAIEWNCCGLSQRETGTKKDYNLYEGGKKRQIFCLDFLFCFLYKLAFASDKKGI